MYKGLRVCITLCLISFGALVGCSNQSFNAYRVYDVACINDKLYYLIAHVEGKNKASRFAHSGFYVTKRERVGIIELSIVGKQCSSKVVGVFERNKAEFNHLDTLMLGGTNKVILSWDPLRLIEFGQKTNIHESAFGLSATHVITTLSRKVMIGCGSSSWTLNLDTKIVGRGVVITGTNVDNLICPMLGMKALKQVSISDDLDVFATHDSYANPPQVNIYTGKNGFTTNAVGLSSMGRLISVHNNNTGQKIVLVNELMQDNARRAYLINMQGDTIASKNVSGTIVANHDCSKVYSFPSSLRVLNDEQSFVLNVWYPYEGHASEYTIHLKPVMAGKL